MICHLLQPAVPLGSVGAHQSGADEAVDPDSLSLSPCHRRIAEGRPDVVVEDRPPGIGPPGTHRVEVAGDWLVEERLRPLGKALLEGTAAALALLIAGKDAPPAVDDHRRPGSGSRAVEHAMGRHIVDIGGRDGVNHLGQCL